jgi:hypothetical protein
MSGGLAFFIVVIGVDEFVFFWHPSETPVKQKQLPFHWAGNCNNGFTGQADFTDFTVKG